MIVASLPPLRVWLDLARAGNAPSVWSNVLAALVLSSASAGSWPEPHLLLLSLVAGTLAYAGGATLNDVADAGFDRRHRPGRAIPSGVISRGGAALVGGLQLVVAFGLFALLGASPVCIAALAAMILLYDWLHKRWAGSVLLMAGCRVCLALTVASLPGQSLTPALLAWLAVLAGYIVGLSVLARLEYVAGAPAQALGRWVGRLLALMPLVDALALVVTGAWPAAVVCVLAAPLGRVAQRLAAAT